MLYHALVLISAFSFLFYSCNSFYSKKMISEYSRWGLAKQRVLISLLQFAAGISLIIGFYSLKLITLISFLLAIMMICALFVRIKIKDSFVKCLPAIFYALLNLIICYISFLKI
tara:strand:+ start:248 stop:589 length:342 start_codon:yes stop_codon:yes gene_type:complete